MLLLTLKAIVEETLVPPGHLGRAHGRHCKIVSADFYPVNWLGEEKEQIGHRCGTNLTVAKNNLTLIHRNNTDNMF